MLKVLFRILAHVAFVAVCGHIAMMAGVRVWEDLREKPPVELFISGCIGASAGLYLFYVIILPRLGWAKSQPRKTDPVIGPAPAPVHSYEEWKADLDKVDGQGGLEEFLAKWSDVPPSMRPKKTDGGTVLGPTGPVGPSGATGPDYGATGASGPMGPSGGQGIPNHSGIPSDVMNWIDKHYERASQLWQRAHPGQDLPHPNSRR